MVSSLPLLSCELSVSLKEKPYSKKNVLKRICDNNEINTSITKTKRKELILLCGKGIQFTFDGKTYVQSNGVTMGSLLGLVLSKLFMFELKYNLVHTISEHLACWKR